jgi:hypothetical protein
MEYQYSGREIFFEAGDGNTRTGGKKKPLAHYQTPEAREATGRAIREGTRPSNNLQFLYRILVYLGKNFPQFLDIKNSRQDQYWPRG